MGKNKNVSSTIKNGSIIQTRDEYFFGGLDTKTGHPNKKDLYRQAVIVETNKDDRLGVVKLTTKGQHKLQNFKNGKSGYKPILHVFDDDGKSIKVSQKFVLNKKDKVSKKEVVQIKKSLYKKSSRSTIKENRSKVHWLKGR